MPLALYIAEFTAFMQTNKADSIRFLMLNQNKCYIIIRHAFFKVSLPLLDNFEYLKNKMNTFPLSAAWIELIDLEKHFENRVSCS